MSHQEFIISMRYLSAPVGIVATGNDKEGNRGAITVSSITCVSVSPPIMSICINRDSWMNKAIKINHFFSISVLREENQGISQRYATKHGEIDKMKGEEWGNIKNCPVIKDALIVLVCKLNQQIEIGTHTVFFGEVVDVTIKSGNPLIYFNRNYRKIIE